MRAAEGVLFDLEPHDIKLSIIEQIEQRVLEPTPTQVETAVSIIQKHLEKEARNRQLPMIAPDDLCPAQKRDMVRDVFHLLRT